ncbi:hypothetical protein [Glycomyces sp. NRRL B-16210]|uniref:hypothetical protein n=1 Tax=Glycomyces sp. NRRL B-16210 TaxID=1463821 RepID=UPI0004BEED5D|nr:hypothetical protein [Glycomyces sp. NRRL B-16210]
MTTALARRRYRLGLSLFLGSARWLRWPLLCWIVLTPIASAVFIDAVDQGLWRIAASVFQWFVAATAGIWLASNLPTLLARGITRREITVAYLLFGLLASIASVAITIGGFAAEHALLALTSEPLGTWGETLTIGLRYLLVTPVYFFAGAFIGAAAARFGDKGWFTVAVLVGSGALYVGLLALEFGDLDGSGRLAAFLAGGIGATAALCVATALALRSIPVRAKRA